MSNSNIAFVSILAIIIIAVTTFVFVNFDGFKAIISGNVIYTADDVENAYNDGQADAQELIVKYNNLLLELQNANIALANAQANLEQALAEQDALQSTNDELNQQIEALKTQ